MKTSVSIPNETFEQVERFARRSKRSRSEVFNAALREYIARHAPDEVTDAINRAVDEIGVSTTILCRRRHVGSSRETNGKVNVPGDVFLQSVSTNLPDDSVANASQVIATYTQLLTERLTKLRR